MRVLVVDDEVQVINVCREVLESIGFEVEGACDVSEAMQRVYAYPPHIIIMDIRMPGVDGTRATRMLKQDLRSKHIPIVILSGLDDPTLFAQAKEYGASACVRKPFDVDEFQTLIRDLTSGGDDSGGSPAS